jgi:hypothetical protein
MATNYRIEFFRYIDGCDEPEVVFRPGDAFPDLTTAISQGALMFATIQSSHKAEGFQIRDGAEHVVARRYADDFEG